MGLRGNAQRRATMGTERPQRGLDLSSTSPRQSLRRVESGHLLHLLSMTGIGAIPPPHLIASQGHAHSRGVRSRSRSPYC